MTHALNRLLAWCGRSVLIALAVLALLVSQLLAPRNVDARDGKAPFAVIVPGLAYQGNASCTGSGCHSADEPSEQSGQNIGDESNIWAEHDPHSHAYETLENDQSQQIAAKLDLGEAVEASRCLNCHALNAPADQRGEGFAINDAVSCEACHGPAEKYLSPHADAGWTAKQRKALGPGGLRKQFGLLDTSNLAVRADGCVACHLQIDKDMVDAGHPPLEFEHYAYTYYISKKPDAAFQPHWDNPLGVLIDAKLWATGQAAALTAAKRQATAQKTADAKALAKLYEAGAAVAQKHFGGDTAQALASADYTADKCAAAAAELATHADLASNTIQRRILAYGVAALASAVFDAKNEGPPDELWNAFDAAVQGDAAALKQMADLAAAAK